MSNGVIFEERCLQKINKLYKQAGKCDDQQQVKDILEADMVSTTEGFNDNSPRSTTTPTPVKKPSDRKSLCIFTDILDVFYTNAIRRVRAAKSKRKAIKSVTTSLEMKPKQLFFN